MTVTGAAGSPARAPLIAGRYLPTGSVRQGSYATVRQVTEVSSGRLLALKQLRPGHLETPELATYRFARERSVAALVGLVSPYVVRIHEAGEDDGHGQPYLIMEWLPGVLSEIPGPMPPRLAATWLLQAAEALSAAHERGFVHRDVKPSNLLLGDDGRLRVGDWGIAQHLCDPELTEAPVATPRYAAPDVALGHRISPQTDLYSLALVGYEWLTGRHPFPGPSVQDYAAQHREQAPPPLRTFNPELPAALEEVFARALTKDPKARQPHVTAFAREVALGLGLEPDELLDAQAGEAPGGSVPSPGAPDEEVAATWVAARPAFAVLPSQRSLWERLHRERDELRRAYLGLRKLGVALLEVAWRPGEPTRSWPERDQHGLAVRLFAGIWQVAVTLLLTLAAYYGRAALSLMTNPIGDGIAGLLLRLVAAMGHLRRHLPAFLLPLLLGTGAVMLLAFGGIEWWRRYECVERDEMPVWLRWLTHGLVVMGVLLTGLGAVAQLA